MPRAKRGTKARARRNKILKAARGMVGARRTVFKVAQQTVLRAMQHAFAGRKQKKRDFRSLWIARINAACRPYDITYSRFMHGLKLTNIELNRKALADLAISDPGTFGTLIEKAKAAQAQ